MRTFIILCSLALSTVLGDHCVVGEEREICGIACETCSSLLFCTRCEEDFFRIIK